MIATHIAELVPELPEKATSTGRSSGGRGGGGSGGRVCACVCACVRACVCAAWNDTLCLFAGRKLSAQVQKMWDKEPLQRPTFYECVQVVSAICAQWCNKSTC